MSTSDPVHPETLRGRIHREMMDSADEELEMELDDSRLSKL